MPPKNSVERSKPARRRKEPPVVNSAPKPEKRVRKNSKLFESTSLPTRKSVEGMVLTVGQGEVGQLGLGPDITDRKRFSAVTGLKNVVDICAGGMHTVCLTSDGSVYTFGCDDDGALGRLATEENSFVPEKVPLDGPALHISAGDSHSAALLEDGRVFAWGNFRDSHGPMGLLSKEVSKLPTLVKLDDRVVRLSSGADHLILLTDKGHLFSCGCPEQGQLGRVTARSAKRDSRAGLTALLVPKPVKFRNNVFFTNIWTTTYGTFAVENNGGVYVFGLNNYHQLGLKATEPVFLPMVSAPLGDSNARWIKVEGGEHHTVLLDENGKVYTMGRKEYGRLGLGENCDDALVPVEVPALHDVKCVDIACGSAVSFAVTEKGECYGWGMGTNGQLGAGDDDSDAFVPQLIRGKQLEGKSIVLVAAGGQHTVILARPS